MKLSIIFHICQWVWLLSRDHVEVEGTGLVQYVNVALRERRRQISNQILILEIKVELGASTAEDRSEEDDEKEWKGYGPEYVALAAVPALEVSSDNGIDSAPRV